MGTTNILDLNNRIDKLADSVTSVEEAVDKLQIKSVIFNETTTANGRIIEKFVGMDITVLKAFCFDTSYIVIPYTFKNSNIISTGFKILSSEGMSAIVNTAVQLKVFYIEQ